MIAPNDTCSTLGQSSKCSRICARRTLSRYHGMSSIHCIHFAKCTICKHIYLSMIAHVNILTVPACYIAASLCFRVMCIYDNLHSSSSEISCIQCPKERHKISQTTRQPASTGTSKGSILSTLTCNTFLLLPLISEQTIVLAQPKFPCQITEDSEFG